MSTKKIAKSTNCATIHFVTMKGRGKHMKYRKAPSPGGAPQCVYFIFPVRPLAMSVDNLMQVVAKDSATGKTFPGSLTATAAITA